MASTAARPRATSPQAGRHRAPGTAPAKSKGSPPPKRAAKGQAGRDTRQLLGEHADRVSKKHTTGRRAGAVKGAAAGAVGGPEGAAIGAASGFLSSSKSPAKERTKFTSGSDSGSRKLLVGEFIVCMLLTALSPITDKHKDEPPATFTIRCASIAGTFVVLALVATGGRGAAKIAAAFGGLVTVSLLVSNRGVFGVLAGRFTADPADASAPGPDDPDGGSGQETSVGSPSGAVATLSRGSHV